MGRQTENILSSILDAVGNTPLVRLSAIGAIVAMNCRASVSL